MPRKSPFSIVLSKEERTMLETQVRQYTSPYCDVIRAKIVLLAAEGLSNDIIAARLDTPRQIVSKWRKRFFRERLRGLEERSRSGRVRICMPTARNAIGHPGPRRSTSTFATRPHSARRTPATQRLRPVISESARRRASLRPVVRRIQCWSPA